MSIYTVLFIAVVIVAILCLKWWHKEFDGEGTIVYAIYIGMVLVLLAMIFTDQNAW